MRYILPLLTMLLTGCAASPEYCRSWGVDVQDGDTVTGEIVEEHIADWRTVQARCQGVSKHGCTIPVGEGQYVIWRVDDTGASTHEWCHAAYEEPGHVDT